MRLRSIRARMVGLSAAAMLIALPLAGGTIAVVLERFVTEGIDRRLDAQLALLASAVRADGSIDRDRLIARAGALDAGPGWRWRIVAPGGTLGSADLPDPLPPPPGRHHRPPRHDDPARRDHRDGDDRVHARSLTVAGDAGPVTLTAAAPAGVIARPIRGALWPLLAAMAALALAFVGATVLQLRIGLRPLDRLRAQVAAIRTGARLRVDDDQPAELRPLARELNALAESREAALATARGSAANLAHALKTPVATLGLTLADDPAAAAQVVRIEGVIRHHLARARVAAIGRHARAVPAAIVADLIPAMAALHRHARIDAVLPPTLAVAVDGHDLTEIVGNLIDNAARHARARVAVAATATGRTVALTIADDGPGIPAAARARVMQAGTRLDQQRGGDGFGLAIAAELVALYGGALTLDDAPGGGLAVTLSLPAAPPAPAPA